MSAKEYILCHAAIYQWTQTQVIDVLCEYIDSVKDLTLRNDLLDFLEWRSTQEGLSEMQGIPEMSDLVTGDECPLCKSGTVEKVEVDGLIEIRCRGECGALLWDDEKGDYGPAANVATVQLHPTEEIREAAAFILAGGEASQAYQKILAVAPFQGHGCQMDIVAHGGPEPYVEGVLFADDCKELGCTEPRAHFMGRKFTVVSNGVTYTAEVVK